jgi:hypothetical protein
LWLKINSALAGLGVLFHDTAAMDINPMNIVANAFKMMFA